MNSVFEILLLPRLVSPISDERMDLSRPVNAVEMQFKTEPSSYHSWIHDKTMLRGGEFLIKNFVKTLDEILLSNLIEQMFLPQNTVFYRPTHAIYDNSVLEKNS